METKIQQAICPGLKFVRSTYFLHIPVKGQLECYLDVGIWTHLLFFDKFFPIVFKLISDKIQILHQSRKGEEE